MSGHCDMALLVQADFDGELSAADAARVELHRGQCAVCRQTYDDLARVRAALADAPLRFTASDELRARLDGAPRPAATTPTSRRSWLASAIGAGAGVAAASVAWTLLPRGSDTADAVLTAHVRALQPGHLTDVVSTDRHTVRPWFDGRIDFAPPVRDLAAVGFPLKGGRLDVLSERPVAALVYARDRHPINLFVWPTADADTAPAALVRKGYNIVHRRLGGMELWAISDLETAELARFLAVWGDVG